MKVLFFSFFILFSLNLFAVEAQKMTLVEWNKLSDDEQGQILANNMDSYEGFEEFEFDYEFKEENIAPEFSEMYQAAKKSAEPVLESLEFDDYHARVGAPSVSYATAYKLEGVVVGINVGFWFQGCDMPDESSPYFEDEKSALAAGCEFSDVSWSWTGSFDAQGNLIYDPGYPEWTGY
jgi:hypothetical protein